MSIKVIKFYKFCIAARQDDTVSIWHSPGHLHRPITIFFQGYPNVKVSSSGLKFSNKHLSLILLVVIRYQSGWLLSMQEQKAILNGAENRTRTFQHVITLTRIFIYFFCMLKLFLHGLHTSIIPYDCTDKEINFSLFLSKLYRVASGYTNAIQGNIRVEMKTYSET